MGHDDWREIVRENNEPGSPNILLALDDAAKEVTENPDRYDQAFIILYKNKGRGEGGIDTSWLNAGLRFSEIVFLLEYIKADLIEQMRQPR